MRGERDCAGYIPDLMAGGSDCRLCGWPHEDHAKNQPGAIPADVRALAATYDAKARVAAWSQDEAIRYAIMADRAARASHPDQPEAPGVEAARKAVQSLGAILSLRPHRQEPGLFAHYFEWVQGVERVHAEIRDALDRAASRPPSSDRIRQETAEERIREDERLRFEGDLDKWMKAIGAGITGYQPEAYAVMDAACRELVKVRAALAEAAEDERDRLYKHATIDFPFERFAGPAAAWLRERVAMLPADRAAKRTEGGQ